MATVLIEGWDHDTTAADYSGKGWTMGANFVTSNSGRFGGRCVSLANDSAAQCWKAVPGTSATVYAGFAIRPNTKYSSVCDVFALSVSGTMTCRVQFNTVTTYGNIRILNSSGTVIATTTATFAANAWRYVEVGLFVNGASGTVEVHVDGALDVAAATGNFGSSNVNRVYIGPSANSAWIDYDDMYVCDGSGPAPRNTFLGDVRVQTSFPSAAGAHTQFQANGAANNWDCVDENTPNGDTDYVSDSNPGDMDTYRITAIDGGASVFGVQTNLFARKDDANTRQIAPVVRQGGTDYAGSTKTLAAGYAYYSQLYDTDPSGSNWTAANVNADEFGVKEIA